MPSSAPDGQPNTSEHEPITVLVVDDHLFFRRGLVSVLAGESDIEVVGEAGDGQDALQQAVELCPDVILMDIQMPKSSGIDACGAIKNAVPSARIVMLTISDEEADLFEALKAGATGYLLKETSITELAQAVRAVSDGQSFLTPSMATKLISEFTTLSRRERRPARQLPPPELSPRELEVLKLIAQCLNNKEISERLFITENTVKNHIRNILEKLQLHSRTEAAVYAIRADLTDPE